MKKTREMAIDGMSCQMCVKHLTKALTDVSGLTIKDIKVGSALVEYDPLEIADDRIETAIRAAGYELRPVA
jgi:Cu+-exporting ATPase